MSFSDVLSHLALQQGVGVLTFALEIGAWMALIGVVAHVPAVWNRLSGQDVPFWHSHNQVWRFALLWTVVLFCCLRGRHGMATTLSWTPLRFLGTISYSLYLWHGPIVFAFVEPPPAVQGPGVGLSAFATAVAIAALSYVCIERPWLRMSLRS